MEYHNFASIFVWVFCLTSCLRKRACAVTCVYFILYIFVTTSRVDRFNGLKLGFGLRLGFAIGLKERLEFGVMIAFRAVKTRR